MVHLHAWRVAEVAQVLHGVTLDALDVLREGLVAVEGSAVRVCGLLSLSGLAGPRTGRVPDPSKAGGGAVADSVGRVGPNLRCQVWLVCARVLTESCHPRTATAGEERNKGTGEDCADSAVVAQTSAQTLVRHVMPSTSF